MHLSENLRMKKNTEVRDIGKEVEILQENSNHVFLIFSGTVIDKVHFSCFFKKRFYKNGVKVYADLRNSISQEILTHTNRRLQQQTADSKSSQNYITALTRPLRLKQWHRLLSELVFFQNNFIERIRAIRQFHYIMLIMNYIMLQYIPVWT